MSSTGNKQLAFVLDREGDIVDIARIASFAVRLQKFAIRVVDVGSDITIEPTKVISMWPLWHKPCCLFISGSKVCYSRHIARPIKFSRYIPVTGTYFFSIVF